MIHRVPAFDPDAPIIVIDIGNTSTDVGTWHHGDIKTPIVVPTQQLGDLGDVLAAHVEAAPKHRVPAVAVGSVVPAALEQVRSCIGERLDLDPLVVGETLGLPIDVDVMDVSAIGMDRVCAAAAAYDKLKEACTVVDFGSAVTVDLVDDEGTLVGGAILPGVRMQLRALHEFTAALPQVDVGIPEQPYGRNTAEAMQNGVCRGVASAVRGLVEAYATFLNRWPHVVATGGDLGQLGPLCDYVDTRVQHLALRGVGVAYDKYIQALGV
jgi:type III pantothenate kinase